MEDKSTTAPEKVLPRIEALREAATIIAGERDTQYGAPEDNFGRIAKIWSVIFQKEITPSDVALAMIGLKMARQVNGNSRDNWVDIAGYAACGAEVSEQGTATPENVAPVATPPQQFTDPY